LKKVFISHGQPKKISLEYEINLESIEKQVFENKNIYYLNGHILTMIS